MLWVKVAISPKRSSFLINEKSSLILRAPRLGESKAKDQQQKAPTVSELGNGFSCAFVQDCQAIRDDELYCLNAKTVARPPLRLPHIRAAGRGSVRPAAR